MDRRSFDAPGPVRAFRDHYVAPFGGTSYDLAPRAVGIHPEHLAQAPDLVGRRVLVSTEGPRRLPLHLRPSFEIVSLTRMMRNACLVAAASGGLVFSSFDLDDPGAAPVLQQVDVGDTLFLNASIGLLPETAVKRPSFAAS